jgi:hypothetical protein
MKPSFLAAPMKRRFLAALVLAALFLPRGLEAEAGFEGRSAEGYRYSATVSPERPKTGDLLRVALRLEGLSAASARIVELKLDSGLDLEAESLRPFAVSDPPARGIELRFELRLSGPGPVGIESLVIAAESGRVELGPLVLVPAAAAAAAAKDREGRGARGEPVATPGEAAPSKEETALTPEPGPPPGSVPSLERSSAQSLERRGFGQALEAKTAARGSPEWGAGMEKEAALWARGRGGAALALLYGKLRRAPPLSRETRDARKAAASCAELLGTDAPILDALPPPSIFAASASLATIGGLALFILERRAKGRGSVRRRAGLWALIALATLLFGLGAGSAAERRREYAVVWTDSLRTVPSALSELSVSVVQGSTARLRERSGDFAGLRLANGVEGWASPDSIFFY